MTVAQMATSLFAANEGYLDDIEINRVRNFEDALQGYLKSKQAPLMEKINTELEYTDEIAAGLKSALDDFKVNHTW